MPKAIKKKKTESSLLKHTSKHVLPVNGKRKKQRNITIGCDVFERWECAKKSLCYKNDDDFVSYLLNVVENQARSLKDGGTNFSAADSAANSKKISKNTKKLHVKKKLSENHDIKSITYNSIENTDNIDAISNEKNSNLNPNTYETNIQNDELQQSKFKDNNITESIEHSLDINQSNVEYIDNTSHSATTTTPLQTEYVTPPKNQKHGHDVSILPKPISKTSKTSPKTKTCHSCDTRHNPKSCPVFNSENYIHDNLTYNDFIQNGVLETSKIPTLNQNNTKENLDINTEENDIKPKCVMSYSEASLPKILKIIETDKGLSVICESEVRKFTKFGPLVAKLIKETDIPDDSGMEDVWEIFDEDKRLYFSTGSLNESNWLRFVRPAPLREDRNCVLVPVGEKVYLVTNKDLNGGDELLYWIDDSTSLWSKKKLEKINCGGCNLKFAHVLYYRTHCSVFHDPAFSLTIRKYHCKVCGEAVLGKENIMRHAAEKHDGKGAYQCQYCKKFFLRLNYLEMHRTYGCSANPQRARPLCDFCGRKFCQPQKLKVHIKRMHSDMADVLRDFQCKLCAKILGSRAALQRHNKEVHHLQITNTNNSSTNTTNNTGSQSASRVVGDSVSATHRGVGDATTTTTIATTVGDIACTRCGKAFQNKSNLKIHMLTHSGVKPFKCLSASCNSAFTTKQCLQFHYRKVHGLSQDKMPKIERSVAYTFDAYAGKANRTTQENMPHNIENLVDIKNSSSDSEAKLDHHQSDNESDFELQNLSENNDSQKDLKEPLENTKITQDAIITNNQNLISKGSKKWLGDTEIHCSDEHTITDMQSPIIQNFQSLHENIYSYNQQNNMLDNQTHEDNSNIILDVVEGNSESIELDRLSIIPPMDRHNSDNLSLFNAHRVPSRASMLVEAALDSVSNIDIAKPIDNTNNSNILHNINIDSEHINIDSMEDYNINLSNDNNLEEMKLKQCDTLMNNMNRLNQYNIMSSINKHEMELDDIQNQISSNLIQENEIDVSSLDSTSLRRSVETYQSLHQVEFSSKNSSEMNRNDMEQDYQMQNEMNESPDQTVHYSMQESEIISPVATPIPRYDFNNHTNLANDLSSDDEGIVQNLSLNLKEKYQHLDLSVGYGNKQYGETNSGNQDLELRNKYEIMDNDFRTDRNSFDPIVMPTTGELQGLDMTSRSYHNFQISTNSSNLNRYHHLYDSITERQTVDLSLARGNYGTSTNGFTSPPAPPYSDVLRVVSLDLTNSGRHNVDMGLSRVHSSFTSQIQNNRLMSDTNSRLITEHRILSAEHRLLASEHGLTSNRLLPDPVHLLLDHPSMSQNRLLSPEPHTRLLDQSARLLEQSRLIPDSRLLQCGAVTSADLTARNALVSPRGFPAYNVPPFQIGPNIGSPSNSSNTSSFHPYTGGYY